MTDVPAIFTGLPIHFAGLDDFTPTGCTLVTTTVLGTFTTYILRDDRVIGRIETHSNTMNGYIGTRLKGGSYTGPGDFTTLAQRIADGK